MSGLLLPVVLTAVALALAFYTYQGIRRGGARFYALEREAVLRRAMFALFGAVLLFLAVIGLLLYERQQSLEQMAADAGEEVEGIPTPTPTLSTLPPTETPTATPDPNEPTPSPTPVVCRGIVRGTGGSGLNLRDAPGGEELETLPEEEIVNLLDEPPVESGGITWVKVRTIARNEGWVALDFIFISDEACLERIGQ